MENLSEKVRNVINKIDKRDSKVTEKINGLQVKATKLKTNINVLTKDLINYDLDEDTKAYAKTDKKVTELRTEYNDLCSRIEAFRGVNSTELIVSELPLLFKIVDENIKERNITVQIKRDEVARIKEDVVMLHERTKKLEQDIQSLNNDSQIDGKGITSIFECIKPLPKVAWDDKIKYLMALSEGDNNRLDSFLIKPRSMDPVMPQQTTTYGSDNIVQQHKSFKINETKDINSEMPEGNGPGHHRR